jgi:hypothetical protein
MPTLTGRDLGNGISRPIILSLGAMDGESLCVMCQFGRYQPVEAIISARRTQYRAFTSGFRGQFACPAKKTHTAVGKREMCLL